MTILDRVKELCAQRDISLAQLEKDLGFSNKSLFAWKDSNPSVNKVKAVADYFGVTVDYLLTDEKELDAKEELLERAFADNPDMRILFKVSEKCSPAEIKTAIRLIQALRGETEYQDI